MRSDFQLGGWLVQPQLNSISRDAQTTRVEPKMMEVLVFLAQSPGVVVSKEQLVHEVWRDTFVTDDVIVRCVSALRRAFGDSADKSAVIETIPKRGYRLLIPVVPIAQPNRQGATSAPDFADSIAVLPFENSGPTPEIEYLSDGVAETIINNLSRLKDLRVVPRTTTFQYKRKLLNAAQVGRELGTRLVLTGHVSQQGDRLVVGTELVDAVRHAQLWGQTYDRRAEEILTIQEEIAGKVSNYLQLRLTDAEKREVTRRSTQSREAHHFLLKAMHFAFKYTPEGFGKGLDFCRQAIEEDPLYADAYAALSFLYSLLGTFGVLPALEVFPRAKAAALKALEIDDSLSDAHAVLGFVYLAHDWDLQRAETEFRQAIELGPHMAGGHYAYSHLCLVEGRYEEALREAERAVDLDPLSLPKNYHLGSIRHCAREYDSAIAQLHKTIELDPSFVLAHNLLAVLYAHKGMPQEAIVEAEKAGSLAKGLRARFTLGSVHAILGNHAEAREILTEVKQASKAPNLSHAAYCALIHALLAELDQAFEWLDQACREREPILIYLRQLPGFESLHGDPRFNDLLHRIGLAV